VDHFEGRVGVVTGAASGIGLALARYFARQHMSVVLADLPGDRLERSAADLTSEGYDVVAEIVDVTDPASVENLAARALSLYGGIDLVCLNAGVLGPTNILLWEIDEDDWRSVLDVNLFGVIHGVRAFVPHLLTRADAHVTITASLAGLLTGDGEGPYIASKHAVVALGEILARQLANTSVGVSILCPWWIRTDILSTTKNRGTVDGRPLAEHQALRDAGMEPDAFARVVADAILTDRLYVHTQPDLVRDAFGERAMRILADCG
jgi:NAD(P)-dependent dehydrogenase (short-subunit alcohol dehydrogenase family)